MRQYVGYDLEEDVQFFIDCMDYDDGGEHYRGAFPRNAEDREAMRSLQHWQETGKPQLRVVK